MKILVTGATGTVGGQVVRQLAGRGHEVRVLVRAKAKAKADADPALAGTDVVVGDLQDAADVQSALDGVDRAFLVMADDNGATFARIAGAVGTSHVVLLSSFTAVTDLPSGDANIISARHRAGEQALRQAGVPATFLRPAGFDYNIAMWLAAADGNVVRAPHPDVALSVVDPSDIAAAAVAVLVSAEPAPAAYLITGPTGVSLRDQVEIVNELAGRSLTVEQNTAEEAAERAFPTGTPEFVTRSVLETMGPAAAVVTPSDDVRRLTGRAPRTFREWALDHVGALA